MKKIFATLFALAVAACAFAQDAPMEHMHTDAPAYGINFWFGLMELPFLFVCVFFAFKTSSALKGGIFGKGMRLMAWGFLVMAIGHIHMQADHFYGINLFNELLGTIGGNLAWFIALVITWSLSGLGFYSIYKASSGKK